MVNVTNAGMIETPSKDPIPAGIPDEYKEYFKWWVASIVPGQGSSAALKPGTDPEAAPYLVIRVNGVRIASGAETGAWTIR